MAQLNGAQVTWLGHATFKVTTPQNKVVLIDPWIEGNPKSPAEARQLDKVDVILVTHGHSDHMNDVVPTAQKFRAQVLAMVETAGCISSQGVENVTGFNIGGSVNVQGITVSMTPAFHSSGISGKGENTVYGEEPVGYVIELENGLKLYHAGDTCAFADMQLIRELCAPDIAMLPIGDFYTDGTKRCGALCAFAGREVCHPHALRHLPSLDWHASTIEGRIAQTGLGERRGDRNDPGTDYHIAKTSQKEVRERE
jgi:L-ascorbate metabolism protein UlaG (beta-lactamase superfamily)